MQLYRVIKAVRLKMKDNKTKHSLLGMLSIVMSDIEALEKVAMDAAKDDTFNAFKNGELEVPTTLPLGASYSFKTETILKSRLTVPLTMLCFSIIDLIGKLLSDKEEFLEKSKRGKSTDNKESSMEKDSFLSHAQAFFSQLAKRDELKNDLSARRFQEAYRHSISHAFLPGATQSVGYQVSYSHTLEGYSLFFDKRNEVILNVKLLTELTKSGINELIGILTKNEDSDNGTDTIINNFAKVIQDNADRLKHLDKR